MMPTAPQQPREWDDDDQVRLELSMISQNRKNLPDQTNLLFRLMYAEKVDGITGQDRETAELLNRFAQAFGYTAVILFDRESCFYDPKAKRRMLEIHTRGRPVASSPFATRSLLSGDEGAHP